MNSQPDPWAYNAGPQYGGMVSGALGQMNPMLGAMAGSLGLDQMLGNQLSQMGVLPQGFLTSNVTGFGPARPAFNAFMNNASRQLYQPNIAPAFSAVNDQLQKNLLTTFYQATDPGNVDARVRQAQSGGMLNPATAGAFFAAQAYDMKGLQHGTGRAAMAAGIHAMPFSGMDFGGKPLLSQPEMDLAFGRGTTFETLSQRTNVRAKMMGQLGANIGSELVNDIGAFGGMKGGELGQLLTRLSGTGGFGAELNKLAEEAEKAGGTMDPEKLKTAIDGMTNKVKQVARTVSSMKDVFGGTEMQALQQMSAVMGVDAASTLAASPGMNQRMLQMRHLAQMTGTSGESLGGLGAAAQQYLQAMGGNLGGASNAVSTTMAIMGSGGLNLAGINEQEFQGKVLRNVVGSQQGQFSRYVAGAYQYWRNKEENKGLSEAEAVAKFRGQLRDRGGMATPNTLAEMAGVGIGDIAAAAGGEEATRLLNETGLGSVSMEQQSKMYENIIRRGMATAGIDLKVTDFSREGIKKAIADAGITGNDAEKLQARMDIITGGASNLIYNMSRAEADQFRAGQVEAEKLKGIADARSAMEKDLQDKGISTEGGLGGLLGRLKGRKDVKFKDVMGGLLGLTDIGEIGSDKFGELRGQLSEGDRALLDEAFESVSKGTDYKGDPIDQKARDAFAKALKSGDKAEMEAAIKEVSKYTNKQQGQARYLEETLKDKTAADAFRSKTDKGEQNQILETALLKAAEKGSGVSLTKEQWDKVLKDGKIEAAELMELGLSDKQAADLKAGYQSGRQEAGLPTTNLVMEEVLEKLARALQALADKP
jgi:hypothetical protein